MSESVARDGASRAASSGCALHVNIVGIDNGAGLSVDARLLQRVLGAAGMLATWSARSPSRAALRLNRWWGRRWPAPHAHINVFLERCNPAWVPLAKRNVLIPNPEWFLPEQLPLLDRMDAVFCKTVDAEATFRNLGKATTFIGFTAEDRWGGRLAASAPLRVLHVAGRSEHKGTARVLQVWARHPEWPALTMVVRPSATGKSFALPPLSSVRYLTERLSDEELIALQREHAVYLLPSEVEGYGQSLVEGMAVGAVVVTTDAPPMNELVRPEHGVLVPALAGERCHLGRLYRVEAEALERSLSEVFSWPLSQREAIGAAGRQWFLENDARFRQALPLALSKLMRAHRGHGPAAAPG